MSAASFRLDELAERFGLVLHGDGSAAIHGVATLAKAGAGELSFLSNPSYRGQMRETGAGAVVLRADDAAECRVPALVAKDPYVAFARIAALFDTQAAAAPGVHPSAVVDPSATIAVTAPSEAISASTTTARPPLATMPAATASASARDDAE